MRHTLHVLVLVDVAKNLQNVHHVVLVAVVRGAALLAFLVLLLSVGQLQVPQLLLVELDQNPELIVLYLVEHNVLVSETIFDELQSLELLVLWLLLNTVDLLNDVGVLGTVVVIGANQRLHEPIDHLFDLRVLAAIADLLHDCLHVLTLHVPLKDVLLVELIESFQDRE